MQNEENFIGELGILCSYRSNQIIRSNRGSSSSLNFPISAGSECDTVIGVARHSGHCTTELLAVVVVARDKGVKRGRSFRCANP